MGARLALAVAAVASIGAGQPPKLAIPACALGSATASIASFANGTAAAFPASAVHLCADAAGFVATFAFSNDTVMRNDYMVCNSPMYNQEVGELFIAPGIDDPRTYIEIEVTPFGALFVNKIENPSCDGQGLVNAPIDCRESGISVAVSRDPASASWTATLHIPFSLFRWLSPVPAAAPRDWRANLFRVRMRESVSACSPDVCDFLCWSPTLTSPPKFHHCDAFAHLSLLQA